MKKVLIISPYFAPENTIASVRFTKFAKYLSKMGYQVSVICCREMATDKKDRILSDDCAEIKEIYKLKPVSISAKLSKVYSLLQGRNETDDKKKTQSKNADADSQTNKNSSMFDKVTGSKVYQYAAEMWWYTMEYVQAYSFIRFYKKNSSKLGRFDCVISSYGPSSAHIFASYLRRKHYCRKWIADFRDVIYGTIREENSVIRKKKKLLAKMCLQADSVTSISDELLKVLESYVQNSYSRSIKNKSICIPNGFDMEDSNYIKTESNPGYFDIAYCGVIYYSLDNLLRDPRPLFQAIDELDQEGKIDKTKIRCHYAGKSYDVFSKFAGEYHLEDTIINHGFVERYQSLDIQNCCDIILSLSWNTKKEKGIMTGKIFEALLVRKNVLSIITGNEPDSALKEMIQKCGIGYAWEMGSGATIEELKKWIYDRYSEKMSNGYVAYHGISNEIDKYTYRKLAEQYSELL